MRKNLKDAWLYIRLRSRVIIGTNDNDEGSDAMLCGLGRLCVGRAGYVEITFPQGTSKTTKTLP